MVNSTLAWPGLIAWSWNADQDGPKLNPRLRRKRALMSSFLPLLAAVGRSWPPLAPEKTKESAQWSYLGLLGAWNNRRNRSWRRFICDYHYLHFIWPLLCGVTISFDKKKSFWIDFLLCYGPRRRRQRSRSEKRKQNRFWALTARLCD